MSFAISAKSCSFIGKLFSVIVSQRTLDGRPLSLQFFGADDCLELTTVVNNPVCSSITLKLSGQYLYEDAVCVNLTKVVEALRRCTDDTAFTSQDGRLSFGAWSLPVVPCTAFTKDDSASHVDTIDASEFLSLCNSVKYAVSRDSARPGMSLINFSDRLVRASDGFRYHELRTDKSFSWDISIFTCSLLDKILRVVGDAVISLTTSALHNIYTIDGSSVDGLESITFSTPKPHIPFPTEISRIVVSPAKAHCHHVLAIPRKSIVEALNDVSVTADQRSPIAILEVERGSVLISSSDEANNVSSVRVACEWSGDSDKFMFSIPHLLQVISTSKKDVIEMRFGSSKLKQRTPIVVWEDESFGLLNQVRRSRVNAI